MEFTGERVIPEKVSRDLFNEHFSRYRFASKFICDTDEVIDIGCGVGYGTYELSRFASNIIGIDISQEAVDYANENYSGENIFFIREDSRELKMKDRFNVAVSFEVIEHIEHVEQYLESVKRCLKEDGIFIVSTPNKKMYSDALENYHNPYHVKEYYYREFDTFLNEYFKYVTIFTQDFSQGLLFRRSDGKDNNLSLDYYEQKYDVESGSFFIAICSDAPINVTNKSLLYSFTDNNIIAEKDRYISALKHEILIRDESVLTIQKSVTEYEKWIEQLKGEKEAAYRIIDELNKNNEQLIEKNRKENEDFCNSLNELTRCNQELEKAKEIALNETLKRDQSVEILKSEIEKLTLWAKTANEETLKRDESIKYILNENEELKKQIHLLRSGGN